MKAFAAWGLTLLGLAVIATLAEMLMPKGKLHNVIRSVIATVTVLVIVTPLPALIKNGFDIDINEMGSVELDTEYLDYVNDMKKNVILRSAREYLKSKGYSDGYELDVRLDGGQEVVSVTVKFSETGITGNGEHINKSEIIRLIAEFFSIGEEAIMTYG